MRGAFRIAIVALIALGIVFTAGAANSQKRDPSPHAEALALVLRTQADEIRRVEAPETADGKGNERWWFDTKERTWIVRRSVEPGVIDSTHLFQVTYRIDEKRVVGWIVDTRKGTVDRSEAKK
jgi:hypothetical protein